MIFQTGEHPLQTAFLAWRQGQLLESNGRPKEAVEQLGLAVATMMKHGEMMDAAMVAFDLAALVLKLRKDPIQLARLASKLRRIVAAVTTTDNSGLPLRENLELNKAALSGVRKLIGLCDSGGLDAPTVAALRSELTQAFNT